MRYAAYAVLLLGLLAPAARGEDIAPQSREQITLSFAPLVRKVSPAVVNIYTQRKVQQGVSPLFADPLFGQFFGSMLPPGMSRERMESSLGSGVIVRADGLIVTSNHVIRDADQIRVVLMDHREFDAKLALADQHSDLAVLRVETKGERLPYLDLKDSDDAEVGDLVLAIGNPFGVGRTVTSGIISAVAHGAIGSGDLNYFIQTDAAINPGNSGGALVTMDGRLVGINSAIYSRDGGNMGIGFAVPSNMARMVVAATEAGQAHIVHPWLGIEGQAVTSELAASMGMPQPIGLLVNKMSATSPAASAGVQVGDVIVSVNGHAVEDPDAFHYRIATSPVGSTAELGVVRKGKQVAVSMKLIAPPEVPPRETTPVTGNNPLQGATIENLSPAVEEEMGLQGSGVVIADVKNDSVASRVGLQPNDILVSINNQRAASVAEAMALLREKHRGWRITVRRGNSNLTIMVGG